MSAGSRRKGQTQITVPLSCVILAIDGLSVSVNHRADRAALIQKVALVRQVRRLADELESLSCQFEKTGALSAIRRFMELHEEGNPNFDITPRAFRVYKDSPGWIAERQRLSLTTLNK